ncbi:ABC transporter permease [Microbacterium saperdae]|uniref:Peptide/nickel transport system permease protein n=1 Tax=Microbacterium saperdae TaxID=69368 RepID=A0A543BB62_9MICO|nr:ABC transporter permease [Microbacterium saperdae]TQL82074.1 peptide/nickel transport system permease protein [Microbacterium saperdae]GGM36999.1 peptide ABC transporter permease [Microbacterium saperdae]
MITFITRRVLYSVPVILVASFILFWAVRSTFDPLAKLRQAHDPAVIAREIERLGLDRSIPEQYFLWLRSLIVGDWGLSTRTGTPVLPLIGDALWPTLQLAFWGLLVAVLIAGGVSVYSAVRQYSWGDNLLTGASYLGIAMPAFWFGLILIQTFAVWPKEQFGLSEPPLFFIGLQSPGQTGVLDYIRHLILPVAALMIALVASWSRFGRAAMLDALSSDYVRTARAKGVPRRQVIWRHAVRNSLAPFVTVVALDAAILIGGLVVTEQIFAIPGMGRLFLQSLVAGDVYVLLPWMIVVAVAVVICNLIADIAYAVLDPRVRLS